jgi:Holliday junction resolvasome RuvABC DNA-binding subunit
MQSVSLTFQQLLECDFNNGLEVDWQSMQEQVTSLLAIGFSRDEALEALIVTGNENLELAAQYLINDKEARKQERERAKRNANKFVSPNRHWTVTQRMKEEKEEQLKWMKKSDGELELELQSIRQQIASEREKRVQLEKQRNELARKSKLALYLEYLKGVTCDPQLNPNEQQQIETWRNQRKIAKEDHLATLAELGYTEESFDKLRTYEDVTNNNDECIVCYEPPRDHMLLPCHHVCLCADCAEQYKDGGNPCPLCDTEVQEVKQVFYF